MNPFRHGKVVTRKDFCPRPELSGQLRDAVEAKNSVALIGLRRTGKTSLAFETVRQIRGCRLIYIHLWAVKSLADIAQKMVDGIFSSEKTQPTMIQMAGRLLSQLRPRFEIDPSTGHPTVTLGANREELPPSSLSAIFDLIEELNQRPGSNIVVFLDELQDIRQVENSDEILGEMRGRIQQESGVSYIFAGSLRGEMSDIFTNRSSPFFKSATVIEVGPIEKETFKKFLSKQFRLGDRSISNEAYDRIFEIADDIPSDVQQLCAAIWSVTGRGDEIHVAEVEEAIDYILDTHRKGFEPLVRQLTRNQMQCLRTLAQLGGKHPQSKEFLEASGVRLPGSVRRALTSLENQDLIYGPDEQHRFYDPFFREWLLRNY